VRFLAATILLFPITVASGQSTAAPAAPTNAVGTQTYSVEGDLLGYETTQSNADAIVCDIAKGAYSSQNGGKCDFTKDLSKDKVMLLSSTDPTLTYFQLWRSAMLTLDTLQGQATSIETYSQGLLPAPHGGCGHCPAVADITSAITSGLTIVQTALGFFATNTSMVGVQGTAQDQPLVATIGRRLVSMKAHTYTPSIYSPFSLTGLDYTQSPFLAKLVALYNTQGRMTETLAGTNVLLNKDQQTLSANQAQIASLQAQDDADKKAGKTPDPSDAKKIADLNTANQDLQTKIGDLTQSVSLLTTMIQNIQSFANSLIASTVGSAIPSPSAGNTAAQNQPAAPTPPANSTGGNGTAQNSNAGSTPNANASPANGSAPAPTMSAPPLVSILYADGVARALGATVQNTTGSSAAWQPDNSWRVLSVKEMENGSSVSSKTRMFYLGNDLYFSGGSIATYSLFSLDGSLQCAGNAFDYGGFIKSTEFTKDHGTNQNMTYDFRPGRQVLFQALSASCLNPLP
jgi:hypothetical protein